MNAALLVERPAFERCVMTSSDWFVVARWIGYIAMFVAIARRVLRAPKPPL